MADFIPRRDCELAGFSRHFAHQLAIVHDLFGISAQRVGEYQTLCDEFVSQYQTTAARTDRTMTRVATKDAKRIELVKLTRELAWIIRTHPQVSNEQLVALGLRAKTIARQQIPAPGDAPIVQAQALDARRIDVRLIDTNHPTRRAKPRDVATASIFTSVGETEPVNPRDWNWKLSTSKTRIELTMNEIAPIGSRVWICACWQNRRGNQGPRSNPVAVRMMFDAPAMIGVKAA